MLFVTVERTSIYVLARYGDYTARSVRRVLATVTPELIREGGVLLVWTQHPHRLQAVARCSNGLLAIHPYRWPWGPGVDG